jgi:hypothetical protein
VRALGQGAFSAVWLARDEGAGTAYVHAQLAPRAGRRVVSAPHVPLPHRAPRTPSPLRPPVSRETLRHEPAPTRLESGAPIVAPGGRARPLVRVLGQGTFSAVWLARDEGAGTHARLALSGSSDGHGMPGIRPLVDGAGLSDGAFSDGHGASADDMTAIARACRALSTRPRAGLSRSS